jgi:hypothetical protein
VPDPAVLCGGLGLDADDAVLARVIDQAAQVRHVGGQGGGGSEVTQVNRGTAGRVVGQMTFIRFG